MGAGAVQHIVVFKFPRELTKDEERFMYDQVRRWPTEIGGFTRLRLGTDMTKARNRGYQYLLFEEFESEQAMQAYFPHPVHQEFARWVADQRCETLAFDYPLDQGSVFVPE